MSAFAALPHDCIILDACCALTVFESGHINAILAATSKQIAIASYVLEHEMQRVDLQPFIMTGQLIAATADSEEEQQMYVNFAVEIDDGEAVTGAIAAHRNWAIATDDNKALKLFRQRVPTLQLLSTPELLMNWEHIAHPSSVVLGTALRDIRTKAKYAPPPRHPLYDWWHSHASSEVE